MTHTNPLVDDDLSDMHQLVDADIPRVDLVGKAANGRSFILMKSEASPNLLDADSVRALIKESEGVAMTTTTDEAIAKADDLDPTVVLADPDETPSGSSVTEPGSPAWEAVDAATARKWTSILSRAKNALGVLADRERVEGASSDSPESYESSYDLNEAAAAVDYAVGLLATFAAGEQAEVDLAADGALDLVGKALAGFTGGQLETVETFGPLVKAGRSLSASNEKALIAAAESIQKVLASLPAPTTDAVTKGDTVAAAPRTIQVAVEIDPASITKAKADVAEITKAEPLTAVFDAKGNLVGVVKPAAIQPITGGDANGDGEPDDAETAADIAAEGVEPDPAADPATEPAPSAEVGTPTSAPAATADPVEKADIRALVKEAYDAEAAENAAIVKSLQDEIAFLKAPATPKAFASGVLPQADHLRGLTKGAAEVAETDVVDMRKALDAASTVQEREAISDQMQALATAEISRIRGGALPNRMHAG